ncbi:MAG: lytic transglycosylase domain-containing protein [Deltaproteobacteria bacterium]|nr:lytic transglycosylase domain-containing protein [Deltaproteobacteria bacterium]MBW2399438.1 lytic transglycosylase domain-containing protein [Deltaproteobacteria bacterium]MBW2665327.1 lytic transglycosylase domain-containing protein [Deltaproteobacteria bacterium]
MRPTDRCSACLITLILSTVSCSITPATRVETVSSQVEALDSAPTQETLGSEIDGIAGVFSDRNPRLLPAEAAHLARVVVAEAHRAGLPPTFVLAVIEVESSGRQDAVSEAGALGLMQIMPATGEFVASQIDVPWRGRESLFDPVINVRLGVHYLEELIERYANVRTALAAYNAGPGDVSRRIRSGRPIPRDYADKVLAAYAEAGEEI